LRSLESYAALPGPINPLLLKEVREVISGRALWVMVLLVCPLVGYSFFQALSLYSEASTASNQSPILGSSLSPLDGILVPTFGSFYVAVTLLFPFVAIRALGHEKETGAIRLLVQLPYSPSILVFAKLFAIAVAFIICSIPAVSALIIWQSLGGHVSALETLNLVFGHSLYGLLVASIALFAAAISESSATAAIITLAFTISSWVLDFTISGQPGLLDWISRLSLTQVLRTFEQGLFSVALIIGIAAAIFGFAASAAVWLSPGITIQTKFTRSTLWVIAVLIVFAVASQIRLSIDVTEDQRNSFSIADRTVLRTLNRPLVVTVHLAPEDPRYVDLRRAVLSKLERAMPNVTIILVDSGHTIAAHTNDSQYGLVEYVYGERSAATRSTSPREVLPIVYDLASVPAPKASSSLEYTGYPLSVDGFPVLLWYFGLLPTLIVIAWWWSRRPGQSLKPDTSEGAVS
jgi:ABC-2 type transport system permease protein